MPLRLPLFFTDHYQIPLPDGHKFPTTKYRLLRQALELEPGFDLQPAPLIARELLVQVHDSEYVDGFIGGTLPATVMRRIGFPWSAGLVARTLASAGATLEATRAVLDGSPAAGALAGGTHHAFRSEGSGFCVFNDIAVAIRWARRAGGVSRVAIVDLDVHQGDGTAALFAGDDAVFTLSLHGAHNFPFRKQKSTLDLEFPDQTGDEPYLGALETGLAAVSDFRPQLIFYQSGVDGLAEDRLGRLALTLKGLQRRDRLVLSLRDQLEVPLVVTMGGGYAVPITRTVEAHAQTYRAVRDACGGVAYPVPRLRRAQA